MTGDADHGHPRWSRIIIIDRPGGAGDGNRRPVRSRPATAADHAVDADIAPYGLTCLLYSTSAHLRASGTGIFWVTTCSNMRASTLIR